MHRIELSSSCWRAQKRGIILRKFCWPGRGAPRETILAASLVSIGIVNPILPHTLKNRTNGAINQTKNQTRDRCCSIVKKMVHAPLVCPPQPSIESRWTSRRPSALAVPARMMRLTPNDVHPLAHSIAQDRRPAKEGRCWGVRIADSIIITADRGGGPLC